MEGRVHVDAALSNVSVGYKNGKTIAEALAPVVPVGNSTGRYYLSGKERFRVRNDARAAGTAATMTRMTLSDVAFIITGHAMKDSVPRQTQNDQDPGLDLITDLTEGLTEQVGLNQEYNLAAQIATDMTGTSVETQAAQPWDSDDTDPIAIISRARMRGAKRCGAFCNVLGLGPDTFEAICNNANTRNLILGASTLPASLITPAALAARLQLDEVVVGTMVYDTVNEGQTADLAFVWGGKAVLVVRPASPGRMTLSTLYHYVWRNALASVAGAAVQGVNGVGQFVRRWFDEELIADWIEVNKHYVQKAVAPESGTYFTNCCS